MIRRCTKKRIGTIQTGKSKRKVLRQERKQGREEIDSSEKGPKGQPREEKAGGRTRR